MPLEGAPGSAWLTGNGETTSGAERQRDLVCRLEG
jgi:hypothetical protein